MKGNDSFAMSQDNQDNKEAKQSTGQQGGAKDQEIKQEPPKVEAPKAETPKKEEAKRSKEKAANCSVCNKSIRKKRYYYRNGKYFCTKRCWKTTLKKEGGAAVADAPKA